VIGRPLPTVLLRPLTVALRGLLNWYMTRFLRGVARRIGTPLPDVSFRGSERMAAIRLGLWSPLLRGSMPSDPPNGTICGYARASGLECATLSPEVDAFLASDRAPIVVGFGSVYARRATPSLLALAQACGDVGRRCLVIGHAAGVEFPSHTLAVRSAPYDRIFPRAAAVVVHRGSGTIGEALRAGRPIVGVPFAYDQFSLCARVERLGVGMRVPVTRRTRADFAAILGRILADDALARRASDAGRRFGSEPDGAELAADAIERATAGVAPPTAAPA
jgi:rhamnosyltransferase subunit B